MERQEWEGEMTGNKRGGESEREAREREKEDKRRGAVRYKRQKESVWR